VGKKQSSNTRKVKRNEPSTAVLTSTLEAIKKEMKGKKSERVKKEEGK
jgi:hypothetical protein